MTAVQTPMWELPIPPANPLLWGEDDPGEVPQPSGPIILSSTATPASGMFVSFECTTDVPVTGTLQWGHDQTYTGATLNMQGQGTTRLHLEDEDMYDGGYGVEGQTYHFRFTVTGVDPPNTQVVGPDGTWVMLG